MNLKESSRKKKNRQDSVTRKVGPDDKNLASTGAGKKTSTKIVLAGKLGLPKVVTSMEPRVMAPINEHNGKTENGSEDSSDDCDDNTMITTASTIRNRDETPEEKKARKKKVRFQLLYNCNFMSTNWCRYSV